MVIDWGLAKDLGPPSDEPARRPAPYRAATPASLTVAGAVHRHARRTCRPSRRAASAVDERADVYALGAMLYHVLAGAPPYAGAGADERARPRCARGRRRRSTHAPAGRAARPASPSSPRRWRASPATATRRARELADDLRRFQTGQLVGAHRYTAAELLRRWLRRHRGAVAVGAAALVAVAIISTIAIQRVIASRDAAEQAREQEEAQRRDADRRKDRAEGLMSYMLNDLRNQLDRLDRLDVLEGIATEVQKYDAEFGSDEADDRTLVRRWELHQLIGDVLMRKGNIVGSEAAYRESMRIAELLVRRRPGPEAERMVADARASIGRALDTFGKYTEAAAELERAVAALEGLVGRADQKDTEEALADALVALGASRMSLGNLDAAQRAYERSRDVSARGAAAGDADAFRHMGQAVIRLGGITRRRGRHEAALAIFEDALGKVNAILAAHPDDFDALFGQGIVLNELGTTHFAAGQLPAALARHREAVDAFSRVARVSPSGRNHFFLALAMGRVAAVLSAQGDTGRGRRRPRDHRDAGVADRTDPQYAEWQTELASDYLLLADELAGQAAGQREARGLVDRVDYILDRLEKEGRLGPAYGDLRTREQWVRDRLP